MPKNHQPFAHALIDAGADIIFGHSGHVVRGIEIYKGKPIIYCAGDFVDDYAVDVIERNDESFIFIIEVEDQTITQLMAVPTIIENCQAQLAPKYRAKAQDAKLQRLCLKLGTAFKMDQKDFKMTLSLV